MTESVYRMERTGLLVDPYHDFLSHGGKLFPMLRVGSTTCAHLLAPGER